MKDLAIILGIRPDVIRASKILKLLKSQSDIEFDFIGLANIIRKI